MVLCWFVSLHGNQLHESRKMLTDLQYLQNLAQRFTQSALSKDLENHLRLLDVTRNLLGSRYPRNAYSYSSEEAKLVLQLSSMNIDYSEPSQQTLIKDVCISQKAVVLKRLPKKSRQKCLDKRSNNKGLTMSNTQSSS